MTESQIKILNYKIHGQMMIKPDAYYRLAYLPITLNEIGELACGYPVVFTDAEEPQMIILTAVGTEKNLGLDESAAWIGKYVPAFLRRYPFYLTHIGMDEEGKEKYALAVDEDATCLNSESGIALYDGVEASSYLQKVSKELTRYENELKSTQWLAKLFLREGILEPREFKVEIEGKAQLISSGFLAVNNEKLNALDDATLAKWTRLGYMRIIELHLFSSKNVATLLDRVINTTTNKK